MLYGSVPIADLVEKVSTWNPRKCTKGENFFYVDLSSVDKEKKVINPELVQDIASSEAPSRARQLLQKDDVLVSTVRPNLNGVALVGEQFDGATASTGYCVLRPDQKRLDSKYLFFWVQTHQFIESMMTQATGANYPAVSDRIVRESAIPLPPLAEQKRIAAILDKAGALRRKRQQAIELADQFLRSVFLEMFGDPVTNPKGWNELPLSEGVASIESGWSANGDSTPASGEQLGVLKISSVTSGVFQAAENKAVEVSSLPANKKLLKPRAGDLIFSRANTRELVAATALVDKDYDNLFLPDKLWRIETSEKLLPEYLHFLLKQPKMRDRLTSQATGTSGSMLNISKRKFEETLAVFPPVNEQGKFSEIFSQIKKMSELNKRTTEEMEGLFLSLSQRAFSGQL